jgi:hypothetical protein
MTEVVLGSTEIKVNKNGFGALPIQRISHEDAGELLKMAYNAGINFFLRQDFILTVKPKSEKHLEMCVKIFILQQIIML